MLKNSCWVFSAPTKYWMSSIIKTEAPGRIHNPLFIYGKSGLGKTHLMHAIGNFITENSNRHLKSKSGG
mgnify:CR=1 FL=1